MLLDDGDRRAVEDFRRCRGGGVIGRVGRGPWKRDSARLPPSQNGRLQPKQVRWLPLWRPPPVAGPSGVTLPSRSRRRGRGTRGGTRWGTRPSLPPFQCISPSRSVVPQVLTFYLAEIPRYLGQYRYSTYCTYGPEYGVRKSRKRIPSAHVKPERRWTAIPSSFGLILWSFIRILSLSLFLVRSVRSSSNGVGAHLRRTRERWRPPHENLVGCHLGEACDMSCRHVMYVIEHPGR